MHLAPKAYELLTTLITDRPKVLSKEILQQRLWPGTFVAEANLSNLIAEIREALGDQARAPQFIRTAHGFGYAFCGLAASVAGAQDVTISGPACWLEWGSQRFILADGENVVGRDPDVEVRLDSSTVSRRHARIVLAAGNATLEDFGSKNGTYHGDNRVAEPVRLADGDAIRIGSVLVTFRLREPQGSTETQSSTHPQ